MIIIVIIEIKMDKKKINKINEQHEVYNSDY